MTHTFKKFTPLFLAGLLCISAAPARSAESWGSFALKAGCTYAAYLGIGLGSAIAHEYGHALTVRIFEPKCPITITIGSHQNPDLEAMKSSIDKFESTKNASEFTKAFDMHKKTCEEGRGLLKPVFFHKGLSARHLLGYAEGTSHMQIKFTGWRKAVSLAAGPFAGTGFCLGALTLSKLLLPEKSFELAKPLIASHLIVHISQLVSSSSDIDGSKIDEALGIGTLGYNAVAISAIGAALYGICKIV